ncbi:hypothetical protein J4460_04640 [Candidatus Woesearchaeota archaeon]|nr:hypothetical protein [uncultured archaeon]MBS3129935.1 hypothetical protein [Candidatus Woesearchaeota archaeon]HIH38060.1 hypothetical protein [Candidatus Woesearchaeota archaeon]HIH49665.1 hypothetical protein [Candidatus Woesearchaeota archaeon]HIJ04301.1 hypothetical protein [Candidatus Woesearchaeota archaeon]
MPSDYSSVIDPLIDAVNTREDDRVTIRSLPQWLDPAHHVLTMEEAQMHVEESRRVWEEDVPVDLEFVLNQLLRSTPGLPREFTAEWKRDPFDLSVAPTDSGELYRSLLQPHQSQVLRVMDEARSSGNTPERLFSEEEIRRHRQWLGTGLVEGGAKLYGGVRFDHYLVFPDAGVGIFSRRKGRQSIERKLAKKMYDLNLCFINEAIDFYSTKLPNANAQNFLRKIRRSFVRYGKIAYSAFHPDVEELRNITRPYFDESIRNPKKDIEDPALASWMADPQFLQAIKWYISNYYAAKEHGESFRVLGSRISKDDLPKIQLAMRLETDIIKPRDIYLHEVVRDWDYVMPDVMGVSIVLPTMDAVRDASAYFATSGDFACLQRFEDHYTDPNSKLRAIQHHVQLEGLASTVHSCEVVIQSVTDVPFYYAGPFSHELRRQEQERNVEKTGARELWHHFWHLEGLT